MRHALIEFWKELEIIDHAITPRGVIVLPIAFVKRRVELDTVELCRVIMQLILGLDGFWIKAL